MRALGLVIILKAATAGRTRAFKVTFLNMGLGVENVREQSAAAMKAYIKVNVTASRLTVQFQIVGDPNGRVLADFLQVLIAGRTTLRDKLIP